MAYDTPAQREILGALGVYAPMGDHAALAEQVIMLAAAPARRAALGAQLREQARARFGWERAAVTLDAVYRQIAPARASAGPRAAAQPEPGEQPR